MDINATIIGQTIAMIFFVWFCMKYIWPLITDAIEARQVEIADGLAAAEKAQASLSEAQVQVDTIVNEARDQARRRPRRRRAARRARREAVEHAARAARAAGQHAERVAHRAPRAVQLLVHRWRGSGSINKSSMAAMHAACNTSSN